MPKIFISYRRDDSLHATGRIYDRLANAFGEPNVFKDVDSMPLGIDFRKALHDQVVQCDVLLAVIGDDWLTAADPGGSRRLDDEADYVRIEIEAALKRDIPVVPLLIGNAPLPKSKDLPPSLSQLAYRNGTSLREDPHFRADVDRVVKALAHMGQPKQEALPGPPGGAAPQEIVAAESVGPPPPHLSGGWQIHAAHAAGPRPSGGFDWFMLARCLLVALCGTIPLVVGTNYDSAELIALIGFSLAPAAALFIGYPWIYEKLWMHARTASPDSYREHIRSEGRLPFWTTYLAVVGALALFGLIAIEVFWTSMLSDTSTGSPDTGSTTDTSPSYDDPSIGYKSLTEAIREDETLTDGDAASESPPPSLDTPPPGPLDYPNSKFSNEIESIK